MVAYAIDFPKTPRISAFDAYQKTKSGKAVIIHAGGEIFERRHIMGAYDIPYDKFKAGKIGIPTFPKTGVVILTYCY
jgi:hypothetical protein